MRISVSTWGTDGQAVRRGEGERVDLGPHCLEVMARDADTVCSPSGNEEMFLEMGRLGLNPAAEQLAEVAELPHGRPARRGRASMAAGELIGVTS